MGTAYEVDTNGNESISGYLTISSIAAPSVSPSGTARLYMDSTSNTLKISLNGGAFSTVGGGGSSTPGGFDRYVQFNDGGVLNGTNKLIFTKTQGLLDIGPTQLSGLATLSVQATAPHTYTQTWASSDFTLGGAGTFMGIKTGEGVGESKLVAFFPSGALGGSLYFRTGDYLTASSKLVAGPQGSVSTPLNAFEVYGGMIVGSGYQGIQTAPTNGVIIEGKLGIGASVPAAQIHVKVTTTEELISRLETGPVIVDTYQAFVQTTNNTPTRLITIPLDDNTVTNVYLISLLGIRTGGIAGTPGDTTAFDGSIISGNIGRPVIFTRTGGGSPVKRLPMSGGLPYDFAGDVHDNGNTQMTMDVSGNNLIFNVTGDTDNNYTWVARYTVEKLSS